MQGIHPNEQVAFCLARPFELLNVVRPVGLALDFFLNSPGRGLRRSGRHEGNDGPTGCWLSPVVDKAPDDQEILPESADGRRTPPMFRCEARQAFSFDTGKVVIHPGAYWTQFAGSVQEDGPGMARPT